LPLKQLLFSLIEINPSNEIQEVVVEQGNNIPSDPLNPNLENDNSQSSEITYVTNKRKRNDSDDDYVVSQASTISTEVNLDDDGDVDEEADDMEEADDIPNRDEIEKYRIYLVWCPSGMYCKIGHTALKGPGTVTKV